MFVRYTDESFKEKAEHKQRKKELGILGPVIRAQIRDIIKVKDKKRKTARIKYKIIQFDIIVLVVSPHVHSGSQFTQNYLCLQIVFKNKASRPYSIYPHGLTIDKAAEGVNYPEGG